MNALRRAEAEPRPRRQRSVLLTGAWLGIGLVGAIDEAVFHQLLQWHTLYWGTDEHGRILSDGLFHVNEFVCPTPEANNSIATCLADLPREVAGGNGAAGFEPASTTGSFASGRYT